MLFAQGKRPDAAAIKAFAQAQVDVALSHDPSLGERAEVASAHSLEDFGEPASAYPDTGLLWVELLRGGLTFDLHGLAPGDAPDFPVPLYRFDCEALPKPPEFEALHLVPGYHLAGGERTVPVAKALLAVARDLVHHFEGAHAIVWPSSASAIGRRFFESVSTAWIEGGPFPALGLTAFAETSDGALQSVGLDFWIGQELRIELPLSADKVTATRLGVRLINQLVMVGGVSEDERIVAPDGSRLVLRLSRNGDFIRVMRE